MNNEDLDVQLLSIDGEILDLLSVGVVVVDPWGIIRFVNNSAESFLGIASIQTAGRRVEELPLRSFAYRVLSESCRDEAAHVSSRGKYLWVRNRILADQTGYFEVFEIQDHSDLRREMRSREESVAMMTHDLKSPLTVMMGYIQALQGNPSPKLLTASVQELDRGSRKLLGMIEDTLDAYRIDVGLIESNKGACPVGDLLAECCGELLHEAGQQGVDLQYDLPGTLPTLYADSRQLSRVFANILSNAIKFTPKGGSVHVAAVRKNDALHLTVADTGVGIPDEEIEKVFLKYYRSSRTHGFKGTGLGLAISKAFVEAHGGEIFAEKNPGGGTIMHLILPLVGIDEQAEELPIEKEDHAFNEDH